MGLNDLMSRMLPWRFSSRLFLLGGCAALDVEGDPPNFFLRSLAGSALRKTIHDHRGHALAASQGIDLRHLSIRSDEISKLVIDAEHFGDNDTAGISSAETSLATDCFPMLIFGADL